MAKLSRDTALDIIMYKACVPHMLTCRYTIVGDKIANPKFPGNTQVVKLSNHKGCNLDVIVRNTKFALTLIFEYYGSHIVNCITGHGLYSAYPYHTLANRVLVNASVVTAHYFTLTDDIHKCMIKYTIRGFAFQTNPLVYLVTCHQCKDANYCPHTVHDIFNHRGLTIAFTTTPPPLLASSEITCNAFGVAAS